MKVIRAQVIIPQDSGLPKDTVVNTTHYRTVSTDIASGDLDTIKNALTALYTTPVAPSVNSLQDFLSDFLNGAGATIKYYDMSEPSPRVPLRTDTLVMAIPAGNGFPSEVSIVCSFEALPLSGVPQNRHRGRIYLGPVKASTAAVGSNDMRVSSGVRTVLNNQFLRHRDTFIAASNLDWIVYSAGARDNSNTDIDYEDRPLKPPLHGVVMRGWCDDSFDTQRRRGLAPTTRTTWG